MRGRAEVTGFLPRIDRPSFRGLTSKTCVAEEEERNKKAFCAVFLRVADKIPRKICQFGHGDRGRSALRREGVTE